MLSLLLSCVVWSLATALVVRANCIKKTSFSIFSFVCVCVIHDLLLPEGKNMALLAGPLLSTQQSDERLSLHNDMSFIVALETMSKWM